MSSFLKRTSCNPTNAKNKNQFQSSIVWTNTNKFINSLLSLDDNNIISILNEKIQGSIGEINKIKTNFSIKSSHKL